jgi:hypothetical protein
VKSRRRFVAVATLGAPFASIAVALFITFQPAIPATHRPDPSSFPAALVEALLQSLAWIAEHSRDDCIVSSHLDFPHFCTLHTGG